MPEINIGIRGLILSQFKNRVPLKTGAGGGGGGVGGGGGHWFTITDIASAVMYSSTVQNVIGSIRISHLYRTFLFFFIFSWPYYALPTSKFKP